MKQFNFEFIKNVVETAKVPEVSTRTIDFKENEIVVTDVNRENNYQKFISEFKFNEDGIIDTFTGRNQHHLTKGGEVFHVSESNSSYKYTESDAEYFSAEKLTENFHNFLEEEVKRLFSKNTYGPAIFYVNQEQDTIKTAREFVDLTTNVLVPLAEYFYDHFNTIFIEANGDKISIFVGNKGKDFDTIVDSLPVGQAASKLEQFINNELTLDIDKTICQEVEKALHLEGGKLEMDKPFHIGEVDFTFNVKKEVDKITLMLTKEEDNPMPGMSTFQNESFVIENGSTYLLLPELYRLSRRLPSSKVIRNVVNEKKLIETNEIVHDYLKDVNLNELSSKDIQWVERVKSFNKRFFDFCGLRLLNHTYLAAIKNGDSVILRLFHCDGVNFNDLKFFVFNDKDTFLKNIKEIVTFFDYPTCYKGMKIDHDEEGRIIVSKDDEFFIIFAFDGKIFSDTVCTVSVTSDGDKFVSKPISFEFNGKFTDILDEVLTDKDFIESAKVKERNDETSETAVEENEVTTNKED